MLCHLDLFEIYVSITEHSNSLVIVNTFSSSCHHYAITVSTKKDNDKMQLVLY